MTVTRHPPAAARSAPAASSHPAPRERGGRNAATAFDRQAVLAVRVNRGAVERRAATLSGRSQLQKEGQAAWLLHAIACMDLTTLQDDDTPGRVRRLCAEARRPVRRGLLDALGAAHQDLTVAAVCVFPAFVPTARRALAGSGIPVAAAAGDFPAARRPLPERLAEIRAAVDAGADEIDAVITRAHALRGEWEALYQEVRAFREACGATPLKVILATGDLRTLTTVARASTVALLAGADFIKTSTGREAVNATLPVGVVMARMIRAHHARTGAAVGLKAAGGIRRAGTALDWLALVNEELGERWLSPAYFRIGASTLLTDIARRLDALR